MTMGARLREERIRLDLSQQALGALGGIETNAQGSYERGKRSPNSTYLSHVASAGVDVLYVITGVRKSSSSALSPTQDKLLAELGGLPANVQKDIKRLVTTLTDPEA